MKPKAFAQPAWIDFQGSEVFYPTEYGSDYILFEIAGFEGSVFVKDYRHTTFLALQSKDKTAFHYYFNNPAHVHIANPHIAPLEIILTDTQHPYPSYLLWVAVGLKDGVPLHDYILSRVNYWDEERFAFLGLYQRPKELYPERFRSMNIPPYVSPSLIPAFT